VSRHSSCQLGPGVRWPTPGSEQQHVGGHGVERLLLNVGGRPLSAYSVHGAAPQSACTV
jgi:hypothetical protein